MKAWIYAGGGVGGYVLGAIVMGIYLANHDAVRPILGGILWPVRLLKLLLGGG